MPTPGRFILHAKAQPPLTAGDYELQGTQTVAGGSTEPYAARLRVTSPRYRMPPDQILSTFPPANAEGAFESRLPQVVIKRRTLPWERQVALNDTEHPWLALVVIAEGEGQLSGEVPVKECITPGKSLDGPNDAATGIYLSISRTVVNKVFPTAEDLPLLAHVREVDLNDTELALGDDDGFLAVIMANRLPQFDRVNCRPVRYMACLINLEGQLEVLPPPTPPVVKFHALAEVQDLRTFTIGSYSADQTVMGKAGGLAGGTVIRMAAAPADPSQAAFRVRPAVTPAEQRSPVSDSWKTAQTSVSEIAVSAAPAEAGRLVRDAMKEGFRVPIDKVGLLEPIYRFPVLAHWSFTCTGAGSFETLMQGLDVGLLGTLPADPGARPAPDCAPPVKGDAPPPAPPSRPDSEVTETGHVGLHHLTRRGDDLRAWYRGPFTLHVTERQPPEPGGRLPLAHTSDHLRRLVPDGREDLALAGAFEIGRLLALSQPSVVSALTRWRREQFGAERTRRLAARATQGLNLFAPAFKGTVQELGALAGRALVMESAKAPEKILAPPRPLADAGRPLSFLRGNVDQTVANGLGFPLEAVKRGPSVAAALGNVAVPAAPALRVSDVTPLREGLTAVVDQLTDGSMIRRPTGPVIGPGTDASRGKTRAAAPPERDALDDLLDAADTPEGTQ